MRLRKKLKKGIIMWSSMYVGFVSQVYGLIKYRDQAHWAKTEHAALGAKTVQARQQQQQLRHKAA